MKKRQFDLGDDEIAKVCEDLELLQTIFKGTANIKLETYNDNLKILKEKIKGAKKDEFIILIRIIKDYETKAEKIENDISEIEESCSILKDLLGTSREGKAIDLSYVG